jgi:hypothetical protein
VLFTDRYWLSKTRSPRWPTGLSISDVANLLAFERYLCIFLINQYRKNIGFQNLKRPNPLLNEFLK